MHKPLILFLSRTRSIAEIRYQRSYVRYKNKYQPIPALLRVETEAMVFLWFNHKSKLNGYWFDRIYLEDPVNENILNTLKMRVPNDESIIPFYQQLTQGTEHGENQ